MRRLIRLVRVTFRLGFLIVILWSNKANAQQRRKTYVLLGCKMGGKYRNQLSIVLDLEMHSRLHIHNVLCF